MQLVVQCIDVVVCVTWNVVVGGAIFFVIGKLVGNRVPAAVELAGLDIPEMGVPGYPEFINPTTPEDISADEIRAAEAELARA
jgi:Amt family ammonium transporter